MSDTYRTVLSLLSEYEGRSGKRPTHVFLGTSVYSKEMREGNFSSVIDGEVNMTYAGCILRVVYDSDIVAVGYV